jgi:hypothetical protein
MNRAWRRGMVARGLLCCALAGLLGSCGEDAPISRLDIPQPSAAAPSAVAPRATGGATALPAPPPTHPPVPVECSPPSPERAGTAQGSHLTFSGVCSFTETGRVACSTQPDDFIFQLTRDTADGPKLYLQVNVEYYKGAGTYPQNVHLIFEIPDGGTIYEWDTVDAAATVDAGQRSGSFDNVTLRPDTGTPSRGTLTVSGSFACA